MLITANKSSPASVGSKDVRDPQGDISQIEHDGVRAAGPTRHCIFGFESKNIKLQTRP